MLDFPDLILYRLEWSVLLAYDESLRRLAQRYREYGIRPCLSDEQRAKLGDIVLDPVKAHAVLASAGTSR